MNGIVLEMILVGEYSDIFKINPISAKKDTLSNSTILVKIDTTRNMH